jgi:putative salt-induced outer membrane protein YdiY
MKEIAMFGFSKALLMSVLLSTALTAPAFAEADDQSESDSAPSGQVKASVQRDNGRTFSENRRAFSRGYTAQARGSFARSNDVYVNGQYAGSDPDPRVRASIRNEAIGLGM